jgi:glycosyltransferase involved in cell wall biosynthesis
MTEPRPAVPLDAGKEGEVDVCVLVEGTYPYVPGGVSAWVHDIILGHPEVSFGVLNIGSHAGSYGEPRYKLPANVRRFEVVYCQDGRPAPMSPAERSALEEQIRSQRLPRQAQPSRVLAATRRMHLDGRCDDEVLADLMSNDLGVGEFLHGADSFDLLTELAEKLAPQAPFLDFFWHFRAIQVPILRLVGTPLLSARCYHAVSTGYAGLLGAAFSLESGRPLVITEHGIYSRERDMELSRATWIKDRASAAEDLGFGTTPSPLRRFWSQSFRALSRFAYNRAARIVTLSDINRRRQIEDGAPPEKISVVPNGVDIAAPAAAPAAAGGATDPAEDSGRQSSLRVGFVGRVVPIKDVITFIKGCDLAMRSTDMNVRIIGPHEEDPAYAKRCFDLVALLARQDTIRFLGPQPLKLIYADRDVVGLTSVSEGQPLVILEAYAAGLPVISTDVGACREMIEGRLPEDRALGPSGIVTRVATPADTAAALVKLAENPALRRQYGAAGRERVGRFYRRQDMLGSYRTLYREMVSS